ncbi:hypothetical protein CP968_28230 [Streptomyces subrutilus]|uniref:Uncharacterized protein n=1 Tax=Streptomyces subrutilus TaxID=36818 RepID=A0A5P2UVV2_9ACTN|nr:hypothetical protein CP968_28230 [Streptomyces subrutilus]
MSGFVRGGAAGSVGRTGPGVAWWGGRRLLRRSSGARREAWEEQPVPAYGGLLLAAMAGAQYDPLDRLASWEDTRWGS